MEQNTPLQNDCWQLMQTLQVNHRIASRMIGTSETTLRKWLANNATGNVVDLEEKIKTFIEREQEKLAAVRLNVPFVDVKVYRTISRGLRACHLDNVMGMIYGESGLGKTTAAQEYAKRYRDVIYIEAHRAYSAKILFKHLHLLLGGNGIGSTCSMMDDVIERLRNSGRFIIIDQAEYLNETTLHLLRTVYDHAHIGIALLGTNELFIQVRKRRGELAQVLTRIAIPARLNRWEDEDLVLVARATFPKQKNLALEFAKRAKGNGMVLRNLMFNTLKIAGSEAKIEVKHIDKASTFSIQ